MRHTLAQICTYLRECDLDEGQCLNVELVLAEALNNICEHAYAGADDGRILTAISCRGAEVQCHITDKGRAMPNLTPLLVDSATLTASPLMTCPKVDLAGA